MKAILSQIHRFTDTDLTVGKSFEIVLPANVVRTENNEQNNIQDTFIQPTQSKMVVGGSYKIKVKKYMTEKSSPSFDFMKSWNNDVPMPFVIMTGTVERETRGMYLMKLHARAEQMDVCMCCGRPLTNPISKLYGLGPECGSHAYINPFSSVEELNEHLDEVKQKIANVTWEGYVIKSAIKEWEEV